MGNLLGRFQILRQFASIVESIEATAEGNNVIRQCVRMILELAPYRSKHCFMPSGRSVERIALLMLERVSRVHVMCALGHSDVVRAVPRYFPGRVSSCAIIGSRVLLTHTLDKLDCNASSFCAFCLMS